MGNRALMLERGVFLAATDRADDAAVSQVFVARDGVLMGVIEVADTSRPEALDAIEALRALGVRSVLLTGDDAPIAQAIAKELSIDDVHAELMPEEKVAAVRRLAADGQIVAMVGDGINDAPALAAATVGIAMGAAGTDAALETADVVLMSSDLRQVAYAVALSRKTKRVIRQNLTFAMGVIATLITATLLGHLRLPVGVVGHEGSTVLVVLNGLRLLAPITVAARVGGRKGAETARTVAGAD